MRNFLLGVLISALVLLPIFFALERKRAFDTLQQTPQTLAEAYMAAVQRRDQAMLMRLCEPDRQGVEADVRDRIQKYNNLTVQTTHFSYYPTPSAFFGTMQIDVQALTPHDKVVDIQENLHMERVIWRLLDTEMYTESHWYIQCGQSAPVLHPFPTASTEWHPPPAYPVPGSYSPQSAPLPGYPAP